MPQTAPGEESIATFAADCVTPKSTFVLGEQVCAKVTNAPLRDPSPLRRINWTGTSGVVQDTWDVTSDPQTHKYTIPSTSTSLVDGEVVDNRGIWSASLNSTSDSSTRVIAYFSVSDPANSVADLAVYNSSTNTATTIAPGSSTGFDLYIVNRGPDAAQNVHVTQAVPPGMTFSSSSQAFGPAFTCTDNASLTDCVIASLPAGTKALITVNYSVSTGGSGLVTTNISSDTNDPRPLSNSSETKIDIRVAGGGAGTCTVSCPADMIVTANASQGGQPGAFVNFSGASVTGDCGAVTNSPASGSFLPAGINTITSSATGASCTFTVNVVNSPAPTISCPGDITVTAVGGADEATLPSPGTGTPTFTASGGGTIKGVRSDSTPAVTDEDGNVITPAAEIPLTAPYPVGVTGILWTVTDAAGRTVTCKQKITVNTGACANDTEAPTITAPDDITVYTGPGNTGCTVSLDDELGQADAHDNCSVNVTVTGIPAGNNFAPGTYTLTYTATDGSGNTKQDTQVVTVIDNTPPAIKAPPDASYTCVSEVPAMNASQATRGVVLDEDGNPLPPGPPYENCGSPVVGVTESRSGAGSASSPLIITRTFTATDAVGNSASDTQIITVIDSTPPTITAPADVTAYTGPGATSCDTNVSNAVLGSASANDNCAVTVSRSPSGNTFPVGTTDVVWTATDPAGNTATATQHVTVVDNTPPVITTPANITVQLPLNSTATSMAVSYNPATATDNCAGAINITYSKLSGTVFSVGTTTVTVTATDAHGNSATATFTVTVLYNFTGFFSPVGNLPTLNSVNAGRAIPVKFSLSGNKGLSIFTANNPYSVAINCDTNAPASDITETLTAGGSSLNYSPDQYNYVWKTESSWAGTCRQLVITLNDGSVHQANFKFK